MVAPATARCNAPDAAIILMEGKSSDHNSNLPSVTFADLLSFFPAFSSSSLWHLGSLSSGGGTNLRNRGGQCGAHGTRHLTANMVDSAKHDLAVC
jgi:hypothetical protein